MKILFYISKKYSIPIISPIVKYLEKTEHSFAYFTSQKVRTELFPNLMQNKLLKNIAEAIKFSADIVIVPGNFVDFRIPGIKVQIFHGLGVEKSSHYEVRHFFDVYCTSGPFVTERFLNLQRRYKYFLVVETGWPKVDHIINYSTHNLKERFNIPKKKKVILFAPTHSRKMQSAESLLPLIPNIINENEIWFLKFHELMDKEIRDSIKSSNNIKIINDYDITPYLHLADILITDTSSVTYEFMILDKPIVTYRTQSRKNKGIDITQSSQLREAIDRSLADPQEFHQNRINHIKEINPYIDGKICENLINNLEDIINNNELENKKKPLNLFRKFQVLYHEKFKKGYLR
ncbi:MAG: CDP-glycerol glycerophosphotransferase family protein [Candidatus Cloacimonetes bacterium]|nr:CDP-glycerol glycerophosphotransferase family protein [Candidatus Cloacimonadota bacterium]